MASLLETSTIGISTTQNTPCVFFVNIITGRIDATTSSSQETVPLASNIRIAVPPAQRGKRQITDAPRQFAPIVEKGGIIKHCALPPSSGSFTAKKLR
ncbi:hypothetical protein B9Z55_006996 [Caenorhabditis nigoni]|uniref:Uncharacterized protein n=1 Tax=Caenorhabditis nigoni TaxID=1611254 RepID=A0A2G5V7J5_9PELO|nr:hypothetical protein B9Z55_006996 [Caenorhabditis nigoni]